MLNWRIACLALSFSFLLLAFGCCSAPEYWPPADTLAHCTSTCESTVPHSYASIQNGVCKCPCESGYKEYNQTCITSEEYEELAPAICTASCQKSYPDSFGSIKNGTCRCQSPANCDSGCKKTVPNSVGSLENGSCKCPCEKGYQVYKGSCISEEEYEKLAPALCKDRCDQISHSIANVKNGSCKCPCEIGYVAYNRTCITPEKYEGLAAELCQEGYPILKSYDWAYRGKGYHVSLCYQEVEDNPIEDRALRHDYSNFVNDPRSNGSVSVVTNSLANISRQEGFDNYSQAEFAISFVQGLPYTLDNVSTPYDEYPRFPFETIYADGGDCEDTAILMAAILRKMGYDVVLFNPPGHVAVGVYCTPSDFDYSVTYYSYNDRDYCYLETAGDESWKVGVLPKEYEGIGMKVVPIYGIQPDVYLGWGKTKDFNSAYSYNSRDTYVNVTGIRVDNFGSATAKNVKIHVALETTEEGRVWSQYTITVGDLKPGEYNDGSYATNLHAPSGESFRVSVVVYGDNFKSVESKSSWVTWH